jgi:type II secretion system protein N
MVRAIFSLRTFLYFVYAVVLTAVLLYIRFPAEKFKEFCEKRLEYMLSDSVCTIDRIAYHFPFSLVFFDVQSSRTVDEKDSKLLVNRLTVTPDLKKLLKAYAVSGEVYGGSFGVTLNVDGQEESFQLADISVKDFDIEAWANDYSLLDRKVAGIIEFSGSYQARFDSPLEGTGTGKLVVADGSMEFLQPVLSLSTFGFSMINVDMTHENNIVRFINGQVSGQEINAEFTGEMRVISPLLSSTLLMSGKLAPNEDFLLAHPEAKRLVDQLLLRYKSAVLPFKVGGSVKRPTFRFST